MRAAILGLVLLVVSAPGAFPSQRESTPPAASATKEEQEIINLSREKWRWMMERNVDALAALLHEQAVFVHMGATMTKSQELEVIKSGRIVYKNVEIQEASVRLIGTTAIVLNNSPGRRCWGQ